MDIGRGDRFGSPADGKSGSPPRDRFGSPIEEKPVSPAAPPSAARSPLGSARTTRPSELSHPSHDPRSSCTLPRRADANPEPTELLLEGGEPFVDVRALTAPGVRSTPPSLSTRRDRVSAPLGSSDERGTTPSP